MRKSFYILAFVPVFCAALSSCGRKPMHVTDIQTEVISIDSSLNAIQDSAYLSILAPYREDIQSQLDIKIGVAPDPMDVYAPESPLLNWATDALLNPIREAYPDKADIAIVNRGGLRCNWPAGDITVRSVFELMPFENEVVILTMKGSVILELAEQIAVQGGQGISGMTMDIVGGHAANVLVGGKTVDPQAVYHVVTSDYLSGGADGMDALTKFDEREMVGVTIRNQYIEYIKKQTADGQMVSAHCDGRIKIK